MNIIKVSLSDLHPSERNVRMHPARQIKEYVRSVAMFGQIRPIVIDESNAIIAGNGLYEAMKQMGLESAECYQVTGMTKAAKEKMMLADNKIYELGAMDMDSFNKIIEDLSLNNDLDVPGWDEELLNTLTASVNSLAEEIDSYGFYGQGSSDQIKKTEERREGTEAMSTAPFQTTEAKPTAGPAVEPSTPHETPHGEAPEERTTEERSFIICPKCGEKIWL